MSWPVGILFLGTGKGLYSFVGVVLSVGCYIGFIFATWSRFGLLSLGIAYCVQTFCSGVITFLLAKRLTGYSMSIEFRKIVGVFFILVALCILSLQVDLGLASLAINLLLMTLGFLVSYSYLRKVVDIKAILLKLKAKFIG
jgi:hypothetical protein